MPDIKYLLDKVNETYKEEGFKELVLKTGRYVKQRIKPSKIKSTYKDILFINGCGLPHPARYRVDHQIEQLLANGLTADSVFYESLNLEQEKYYNGFIFFRCPITPTIEEFIKKAKSQNKPVFYDIDDLVFDEKYPKTVKHLEKLSQSEQDLYYDGVRRMGDTLKLCDYAITTTEALAGELKKYVKEVFINRNTASEKMAEVSLKAIKNVKKEEDKVIIGYLSGSITHNADFEMILPVIDKIMDKNPNVFLRVGGILDIPEQLKPYEDRIIISPFVSWKQLPEIIATLDINLSPIESTLFNDAKSENKWVEASLCEVVTVASDFGAFKRMINDKVDGFLCKDEKEWYDVLQKLIDDKELRTKVGKTAQKRVLKENVTTYTGYPLVKFITSKMPRVVAFVLPTTNISGGVNVILKHCNTLKKHGMISFVINCDKSDKNIITTDSEINVISNLTTTVDAKINMMTASLWTTLEYVRKYPKAKEKGYLVQGFETDFMKYGDIGKITANSTYSYDEIKYITVSKWCQNWLKEKYGRDAIYIPNGINLQQFPNKKRTFQGKIKILVEGNCDDFYKNVDESFKITNELDKDKYEIHYLSYQGKQKEWYQVDKFMHRVPYDEVGKVYQEADILLKSSTLESFSYPPLEMMATSGISVVVKNDGNQEYLKDNENCLFYQVGNVEDGIEKINKIAKDKKLREKLISNGEKTAKERSWDLIEKDIVKAYSKN